LVPQAMSLPADQQAVLLAETELLSRLGFVVEQAGPRLLRIVQAPTLLRGRDLAAELADLAASLLDGDRGRSLTERLERTAATLACHAAFRAGDPLQPEAVQHLLAAMDHVDLSGYCPHGRPAVLRMPLDQLGRLFHRS
jgi:DNA mismatch repair protein MutL